VFAALLQYCCSPKSHRKSQRMVTFKRLIDFDLLI